MTDDEGTRVGPVKLFEERTEGGTLLGCASVLRIAFRVESTFVTDADGVAVVVFDVGTDHGLWATKFYAAITTDDVMISDAVGIASGAMPLVNLFGAGGLVRLDGRAMDD